MRRRLGLLAIVGAGRGREPESKGWNVVEIDPDWSSDYGRTVIAKIAVVAASSLTAFLHARAASRAALAAFGALSGVTALGTVFFGVLLG